MKILIAYDGSVTADTAIEDLRRAGLPEHAEAVVVCVEDGALPPVEGTAKVHTDYNASWRTKLAHAEELAEKARKRILSHFPRWKVSSETLLGSPAKIILDTAVRWHPDLLVAGSHGRSGAARLFLGSVSLELIHHAPCSVRVARTARTSNGTVPVRIIIGNDGSPEAEAVIRSVAARAWPGNTEAHIISVLETLVPEAAVLEASTYAQEPAFTVIHEVDERERARLRKVAEESAQSLRRAGLIVTSSVVEGTPREVILADANLSNADAIFVGDRGLGRMERLLLGSVSTYLLTHAHCTVEVVRHAAAETAREETRRERVTVPHDPDAHLGRRGVE